MRKVPTARIVLLALAASTSRLRAAASRFARAHHYALPARFLRPLRSRRNDREADLQSTPRRC